jgi:hypothetical protein
MGPATATKNSNNVVRKGINMNTFRVSQNISHFAPRKLSEHEHNCDVFCSMLLNMFDGCRLMFQYRDLLMTEVKVVLSIPSLCFRSSIYILLYFQYSQHNGTQVIMSHSSTNIKFKVSYCIVTGRGYECGWRL